MSFRIGLISDTHGLLRPQALAALQGCDLILHAGDIGGAAIVESLAQLAPVHAVRGNNDKDEGSAHLPEAETIEAGGVRIHLLHDLKQLALDPRESGVDVVVTGHSHRPRADWRDGILFINPGSAGPRRFTLPLSVGFLSIQDGRIEPLLLALEPD